MKKLTALLPAALPGLSAMTGCFDNAANETEGPAGAAPADALTPAADRIIHSRRSDFKDAGKIHQVHRGITGR